MLIIYTVVGVIAGLIIAAVLFAGQRSDSVHASELRAMADMERWNAYRMEMRVRIEEMERARPRPVPLALVPGMGAALSAVQDGKVTSLASARMARDAKGRFVKSGGGEAA